MHVGGGTVGDAARSVAAQPVLWAGGLALALSHLRVPLPTTVCDAGMMVPVLR